MPEVVESCRCAEMEREYRVAVPHVAHEAE